MMNNSNSNSSLGNISEDRRDQLLAEFDRIAPHLVSQSTAAAQNSNSNGTKEGDIQLFRRLFCQFLDEPCKVDWSTIRPMPAHNELPYAQLPCVQSEQERKALLGRLVVVKLNGGLGTTMGCHCPKSLVELRDGHNFLDFALRQHQILNKRNPGSKVPLLLMNSFYTDQQIRQYLLEKRHQQRHKLENKIADWEEEEDDDEVPLVKCFCQSKCPRIFADTLLPVPNGCVNGQEEEEGWYPPGHGNVFWALAGSEDGLLDALLAQGRDVAFFANIDNTGAIFDEKIAKLLADGRADYVMEVTPRTAADVKGGTLVELNGGERLMHLECPQVPDDRVEEFCSLRTFKSFNTNNIWVNLAAVRDRVQHLKMEILANAKQLSTGERVLQLEQSIGGAIRNFPARALAVCVPRARFLPVKSTRDLFRMRSDCLLEFVPSECLLRQRKELFPALPDVLLSPNEFGTLREFEKRIPEIPTLGTDVQRICLQGNVWLGRGVQIHAKSVELEATGPGECLRVPDNSLIGKTDGGTRAAAEEEKKWQQQSKQQSVVANGDGIPANETNE